MLRHVETRCPRTGRVHAVKKLSEKTRTRATRRRELTCERFTPAREFHNCGSWNPHSTHEVTHGRTSAYSLRWCVSIRRDAPMI